MVSPSTFLSSLMAPGSPEVNSPIMQSLGLGEWSTRVGCPPMGLSGLSPTKLPGVRMGTGGFEGKTEMPLSEGGGTADRSTETPGIPYCCRQSDVTLEKSWKRRDRPVHLLPYYWNSVMGDVLNWILPALCPFVAHFKLLCEHSDIRNWLDWAQHFTMCTRITLPRVDLEYARCMCQLYVHEARGRTHSDVYVISCFLKIF